MFLHYTRIVFRTIIRHKSYTGIVVSGLAIAMTAYLLISGYVDGQRSFDRMHADGDRIYRVETLFRKNGEIIENWPTSTNGMAPAIKTAFPETEAYTRINWRGSARVVRYEDVKFREEYVCFADSNFFTFFGYPVLKGDRNTFLKAPNTVVISEAAAQRYFKGADPMGKMMHITAGSRQLDCEVTGVFADLPANSTMQFDMLMSWTTSNKQVWDFWYQHESYTFVRLHPSADPHKIEAQFPALAEKYKTAETMRDHEWGVELVPLHDIHLNPAKPNEVEVKGNRQAVTWLSAMALVILLMGWFNYINLSTARAMDRTREIGVRKAVGAEKGYLLIQFLTESLVLNAFALVIALVVAAIASYTLPAYLDISLPLIDWANPMRWLTMLAMLLIGVLVSGLYPALVLANVKPVLALKGRYRFSATGGYLRQGLVVLQFSASMILLVGTVVAYRQLSFMTSQQLGVNTDQILVLHAPVSTTGSAEKLESFRNEVKRLAGVEAVTGSGSVPGLEVGQMLANRRFGANASTSRLYESLTADYEFIPLFGLQLVAGRNFDRGRASDVYGLVLNEAAVAQFGFNSPQEAIGQRIALEVTTDRPNEIIGVVKNYHQQGLQRSFTPIIMLMDPDYKWLPTDFYSVKVSTKDADRVLKGVQANWAAFFPESPMNYFFLDEFFNNQYKQDQQFGRSFMLFASLAILIACLGLFGLTSYSTARRTKEIGVRKSLGASVNSILAMLAWDTLRLVLIASVLAVPLSWYLVSKWLETYAFRIDLDVLVWFIPVLVLGGIALLTIGYQTTKAALANPVKALKSE